MGDCQQGIRWRQQVWFRTGVPDTNVSAKKGGRLGGKAAASRPQAERSASAKKAAATRKRNEGAGVH